MKMRLDYRGRGARHPFHGLTLIVAMSLSTTPALADLDISPNALEAVTPVEPNIVLLSDDSGSMDWEILTTDGDHDFLFTGPQPDGSNINSDDPDDGDDGSVTHRSSCDFSDGYSGDGYAYIAEFGSNQYGDGSNDCYTADDNSWRARNSDFNRLYFNPQQTYEPWAGLDASGSEFTDIDVTHAPNNPYDPTEHKDLTSEGSGWDGDDEHEELSGGFRFFTWSDSDGDKKFDNNDYRRKYKIGKLTSTDITALNTYLTGRYGADAKQYADAAELQKNFANWFGYYRRREFSAKAALSTVIRDNTSARIGYATIHNNNSVNKPVASMNISPFTGAKSDLLKQLYQTNSSGGTPLRKALRDVGGYFECDSSSIFNAGTCPQNQDKNGNTQPGGACRQNYAVVMTDGYYNGGSPGVGNTDDGTGPFDGGAFADNGGNRLADVSMHYYERDLHSGLSDLVPTTSRDRNLYRGSGDLGETMHQHMATYTIGFGVNGTLDSMPAGPDDTDSRFWPGTNDEEKIDDLRHAAFNGRGDYLSASDPNELADSLQEIFDAIAAGVGAGSAVAFNTQNIRSDSVVFRAFYNTKTNAGDLVAQKINNDGSLKTQTEWSAAEQLDDLTSSAGDGRRIITYDPVSGGAVPFTWPTLTASQQTLLHDPTPSALPSSRADNGGLGDERLSWVRGHSTGEGIAIDEGDLREREITAGRLGDITHSSPTFSGAPPFANRQGGAWPSQDGKTYADFKQSQSGREEVVYVGANDGMLHAFSADTGDELFAYIPSVLLDGLPELASSAYNHRFYVDGSPAVNDAYLPALGGWRSVLIGGLGAGGKGYYAIDVTDPSAFATETDAASQVLWEFTAADDADLGLTYSEPLIAMSNASGSTNKRWVAIFGNGYNGGDVDHDGDAALFIAFIEEGTDGDWDLTGGDYVKINTGRGFDEYDSATMPHLAANTSNGIGDVRVIDYDGNGTADYVYAGDLQGHLYRFDISDSDPSKWQLDGSLFQARYSASGNRTTVQPITKAPVVVRHPDGGLVVVQGTGSWMTTDDATSTEIQSIYGIWDPNPTSSPRTVDIDNNLVEQTFFNEVDPVNQFVVRTSSDNKVEWNDSSGRNAVLGWHVDLDMPAANSGNDNPQYPGEKAVRNLQYRGGVVFVNTIIPKTDAACETVIGGYELGINPLTGGTPEKVVFDSNNDGVFDLNDNVDGTPGQVNQVTGLRFDGGIPTDAGFIGNQRITQVGEEVRNMRTNTGNTGATGRLSWREVIRFQ